MISKACLHGKMSSRDPGRPLYQPLQVRVAVLVPHNFSPSCCSIACPICLGTSRPAPCARPCRDLWRCGCDGRSDHSRARRNGAWGDAKTRARRSVATGLIAAAIGCVCRKGLVGTSLELVSGFESGCHILGNRRCPVWSARSHKDLTHSRCRDRRLHKS